MTTDERLAALEAEVGTLRRQLTGMQKLFFQDRKRGNGHSELRNATMVKSWLASYPAPRQEGEA